MGEVDGANKRYSHQQNHGGKKNDDDHNILLKFV